MLWNFQTLKSKHLHGTDLQALLTIMRYNLAAKGVEIMILMNKQ